jgi:hypothetical protein
MFSMRFFFQQPEAEILASNQARHALQWLLVPQSQTSVASQTSGVFTNEGAVCYKPQIQGEK